MSDTLKGVICGNSRPVIGYGYIVRLQEPIPNYGYSCIVCDEISLKMVKEAL